MLNLKNVYTFVLYLNHANALRETGLAPPISQQWDNYGKIKMRRWILRTKKKLKSTKKKKKKIYLCVACSRYFSTPIYRVSNKQKTFQYILAGSKNVPPYI